MITYTKTITETKLCPTCHGKGNIWVSEYHNQTVLRTCWICNGEGKRNITWSVDITHEIEQLLNVANALSKKI